MVITYKCPNCGAGLEFDSEKQMLVCVHCGTEKSVEEMEQMEQKESKSASQTNDFKMFHCPVCGAEILTDEHTSATFCSYCGSTALIESRLTDELAPAYVIPFQINREQAKEVLPPGISVSFSVQNLLIFYIFYCKRLQFSV